LSAYLHLFYFELHKYSRLFNRNVNVRNDSPRQTTFSY